MAVLTGSDGQLKYGTSVVAKCRDWSITMNADALEDTCLASYSRTYVKGLKGSTGSATILYDPNESSANDLLNSIFSDTAGEPVGFVFNRKDGQQFLCEGFVTSVSQSVTVGDIQAVSVSFQVSGDVDGTF